VTAGVGWRTVEGRIWAFDRAVNYQQEGCNDELTVQRCRTIQKAGWPAASCFLGRLVLLCRTSPGVRFLREGCTAARTSLGHLHEEKFLAFLWFGYVRGNEWILL
jgi:hypothetical protein